MKESIREIRKSDTKLDLIKKSGELLRVYGISGLSINTLMDSVGLTRGSFYVYFKNKSEMISIAFKDSVEKSNEYIKTYLEKNAKNQNDTYEDFINLYLSDFHRANVRKGCPISALSSDFAKANLKQRREFANMLSGLFESRRNLIKLDGRTIEREQWIGITSTYIGSLILSRATKDTELSQEILNASKNFLLNINRLEK